MRYSLRPATSNDLDAMMAIGNEGIRPYVEEVRGWDEAEETRGFVEHFLPELTSIIVVDGHDVGYLKTESHADHVYIDGIYLAKAYRSSGLGTLLISRTIADAHAKDKRVRLRVLKPNPARRLYDRLGFCQIDTDTIHISMEA